jgi:hypothetical protein
MENGQILDFIYSVYPKGLDFVRGKRKEWLSTKEHMLYKTVRAARKNNFGKRLKKMFEKDGYFFKNSTSNKYPCYEYTVSLDKTDDIMDNDIEFIKSLGGVRREIYIYVSKILNCYTYFCLETKIQPDGNGGYKWRFSYIDAPECDAEIELKMRNFFNKKDMFFIEREKCAEIVPGISTELTEMNKTTVFNLLFSNLYNYREESTDKWI